MLANTLAKKVGVSLPHIFQIFYKIDSQFTRTFRQSFFCPSSDLYTPLLKPGKCAVKCHSPELDVSFMHIYVGKEIFNVSRICWAILNTYVYMQKNVGKKSRKPLNWGVFQNLLKFLWQISLLLWQDNLLSLDNVLWPDNVYHKITFRHSPISYIFIHFIQRHTFSYMFVHFISFHRSLSILIHLIFF